MKSAFICYCGEKNAPGKNIFSLSYFHCTTCKYFLSRYHTRQKWHGIGTRAENFLEDKHPFLSTSGKE